MELFAKAVTIERKKNQKQYPNPKSMTHLL